MKRSHKKMCMRLLFCICMFAAFSFVSKADKLEISFDVLYPQTPFKHTLRSCCEVLQGFDVLHDKKGESCDCDLLTDAIVGKLFHIKMNMENIRLQKPQAHLEDIAFLERVFDKILLDYKRTCSGYLDKPKSGYVVQLIHDIKAKCETLR